MKTRNAPSPNSSSVQLLLAAGLLFLTATLCLYLRAVPKQELWTITAVVLYLLFATSLQPGALTRKPTPPLARKIPKWAVRLLLLPSLCLSIVIPWLWIARGADEGRVKVLAPHLFVMMAQVLFEIWSYCIGVTTAIRVGIPVGFVAYRIRLLVSWITAAWAAEDLPMTVLAGSNLAFWSFIFFYVLLIRVCPFYFMQRSRSVS